VAARQGEIEVMKFRTLFTWLILPAIIIEVLWYFALGFYEQALSVDWKNVDLTNVGAPLPLFPMIKVTILVLLISLLIAWIMYPLIPKKEIKE
jgi:hypothetical protein